MNLIRGEAKKMDLFGVNLKNYKRFFELQSQSAKKGIKTYLRDYMNKLRTAMIVRTVEKKEFILPCKAGTLMAVMYEKGDVYPCELLNGKALGNVREYNYDFTRLWTSQKAKATAKGITDTKCYCTHECFLRFNLFYKPSFLIKNVLKTVLGEDSLEVALQEQGNHGQQMIQIGKIRGIRKQQENTILSQKQENEELIILKEEEN